MAIQQTIRPDLVPPAPVPRRLESFKSLLERLFRDRWISWVLVIAVAAAYGELASEWTPRGPLSAFQALTALGLGLLVGMAAGLMLRTRWAMLVAPAAFALTFELGRLDVAGPTVDSIHLDSTYGIMAFVVGRGVHGLLTLLPMILGAALGAAWARRWWPAEGRRTGALHSTGVAIRRTAAGLTALALLVVVVVVARPATTDADRRQRWSQHPRQRCGADPCGDQRPRPGPHGSRQQRRQPGAPLPRRRSGRKRAGCHAHAQSGPRGPLRGRHLGPAGHGQVLRPARPSLHADRPRPQSTTSSTSPGT